MKNFETRFNRTRKVINIIFIFNIIAIVAIFIGISYLGWNLFHNPESIGEFFGKIVKGFNTAN